MKRKVYSLRSMPKRAAFLGSAAACGITSAIFVVISVGHPIEEPESRLWLLTPATGCAVSGLYMLKEAFKPEEIRVA